MTAPRALTPDDRDVLAASLANDACHTGTSVEFFYEPRSLCNVYEDEHGPVMVVRGTKALRLDIQFLNNDDHRRNAAAMCGDFERFIEQARRNGFTEVIFDSNSPRLRAFCKRRFKFREVAGELRRLL